MDAELVDVGRIGKIPAVSRILDVVCRMTGMGFAAVARVTDERWIACGVNDLIGFGLKPGGELKLETTICHEIRASRTPVIIDNVADDKIYSRHHTPEIYGIQSYISMPIILSDGNFFGTLCAIDPRPAQVSRPEIVESFRLFAELIAFHLDAQAKLDSTQEELLDEQYNSVLREQFIAVLGHDLRNPLSAIDAGAKLLQRSVNDSKSQQILTLMAASVTRMAGIIENVMDLARGRLGGGFTLDLEEKRPVLPILNQVVDELRAAWPNRTIETVFAPMAPFSFDAAKLGQLFSNLVGNALVHGADGKPVFVGAEITDGTFEFWVSNAGEPLSEETLELIFKPFHRGKFKPNQQGLGLGLYICSEIAKAHGGKLTVVSSDQEIRFTFRLPVL